MLSAYETGRQRPSLETLEKILGTLGCNLHDLHNALRIVNGDMKDTSSALWSSPRPVPADDYVEPPASGPSDLYGVLGIDHRLDPEEEAALSQMLSGFHRLLRHFHRSLRRVPGASPFEP